MTFCLDSYLTEIINGFIMNEWDLEQREYDFLLTSLSVQAENIHTWASILTGFSFSLIIAGAVLMNDYGLFIAFLGTLLFVAESVWYNWKSKKINKLAIGVHKTYIEKYYPKKPNSKAENE